MTGTTEKERMSLPSLPSGPHHTTNVSPSFCKVGAPSAATNPGKIALPACGSFGRESRRRRRIGPQAPEAHSTRSADAPARSWPCCSVSRGSSNRTTLQRG